MEDHAAHRQRATSTHPASTTKSWIPNPSRWHKTANLPDGTPISRLGAYWYILDHDGHAISEGYHEIYLTENGDYEGKRSARREPITLHPQSKHA